MVDWAQNTNWLTWLSQPAYRFRCWSSNHTSSSSKCYISYLFDWMNFESMKWGQGHQAFSKHMFTRHVYAMLSFLTERRLMAMFWLHWLEIHSAKQTINVAFTGRRSWLEGQQRNLTLCQVSDSSCFLFASELRGYQSKSAMLSMRTFQLKWFR